MTRNPIVHQLQFLPFLYKEPGDGVCVTDAPLQGPACYLLSDKELPFDQVESWGPSRAIENWAKQHHLLYPVPPWEVTIQVNSKAFSFQQIDPLPNGELLTSRSAVEAWVKKVEGPKVLKTCFGLSGQGHLLLPAAPDKIQRFVDRELSAARPLIGEPWVRRQLDFSTQWIIAPDQSIVYAGSTILLSDEKGEYAGNKVGDETVIFGSNLHHLEEHKKVVFPVLKKMASLGFFGNVGIDAMVWGDGFLHPIVEINARKTMGWVAIQIAKRLFPNQTIQVSYGAARHQGGLLPQKIVKTSGEIVEFRRNLYAAALAK